MTLAGDDAGEGTPVVLLHGLTATRRYVVMGSRALERDGHRVIAYDARGHGALRAGARAGRLRLRARWPPTCSPCSTTAGSSARCWPAPRWARTRSCASRSTTATASPASWSITPAFEPDDRGRGARGSRAGTRSRTGLREGGVEGFVEAYGEPKVPEQWRETVFKVLRQRLARARAPRGASPTRCARSRARAPFEAWDELAELDAAGRRGRQPRRGRPGASVRGRRALRRGDPGRRAASPRSPATSPLAWQGSQLSRVIAELAAPVAVDGGERRHPRHQHDRALDHGLAVVGGGEAPARRPRPGAPRSRRRSPGRARPRSRCRAAGRPRASGPPRSAPAAVGRAAAEHRHEADPLGQRGVARRAGRPGAASSSGSDASSIPVLPSAAAWPVISAAARSASSSGPCAGRRQFVTRW